MQPPMPSTSPPLSSVTPMGSSGSPSPTSSRFDLGGPPVVYSAPDTPTGGMASLHHASSPPTERTQLLSPGKQIPRYWSDTEDGHSGPNLPRSLAGFIPGRSPSRPKALMVTPYRSREPSGSNRKTGVASKIRQRSKYYVPVTDWLPQYSWSLFSGDLVAGISVACLLIPQAMSYADGLAKLTPVAGLWSTAIAAAVYGALGTCRQLSMGPEASLSLLLGHTIQEIVYSDPHGIPENAELEAAAVAVMITFQAGVITSVLGLLRLGFLDVVLSRALLRGFITAIGVIIFIEQAIPLLGLGAALRNTHPTPVNPVAKLVWILQNLGQTHAFTAILSACCLGFLIFSKVGKKIAAKRPGGRWLRFVPEILILVVTVTILSGVFRWDERGVEILGKIRDGSGFPLGLPITSRTMKYFGETFPTAFVMAVVGVVDSMVAARENATKYGYPVSPNRELVALGASNLAASLVTATGTLPIFGSLTRSRLNGQTGGRTQMAGLITASLLILAVFFILPLLYFLPKAVLASIITLVVYSILDEAPHDIIYFWKMKAWPDFLQMTGTFLLTLFFSIETGLLASVGFSLILVIQRSTQPRIKIIGRRPDSDDWVAIDEDEEAQEEIPGVLVVRIRESLSFANTGQLKERLRRLELYGPKKSHPADSPRRKEAKAVIMHMGDYKVDEIDASALQILSELVTSYHERGVGIYFAHLKPAQLEKFKLVGIPELLGPHHFQPDLRSAMLEVESLGFGNRMTTTASRFTRDRFAGDA